MIATSCGATLTMATTTVSSFLLQAIVIVFAFSTVGYYYPADLPDGDRVMMNDYFAKKNSCYSRPVVVVIWTEISRSQLFSFRLLATLLFTK